MNELFEQSIRIILENQSESGAYPASPNFPTYRYSWFRDGAFIAFAMNLVGEHQSAARFHNWVSSSINRREDVVTRAVSKAKRGEQLDSSNVLHTRYSIDGELADEDWPNFQLDGFGTWLWGLGEHIRISNHRIDASWEKAASLTASYLAALWQRPCYDCWEEFPDKIHLHTLAAIYGGLQAYSGYGDAGHKKTLDDIRDFICREGVHNGRFVKYLGSTAVDASLLGLAIPYGVIEPLDPLLLTTVDAIDSDLRQGGGVHRYDTDTYYGGGEWVLLTAWLSWYYVRAGEMNRARDLQRWIEEQADDRGALPEQVPQNLIDPAYYPIWQKRWGDIAKPLLWSHAKYIIMMKALEAQSGIT